MAVPLTNSTALKEEIYYGWMSSSSTRGTANILYACLAIITICVYSAVHLNIPAPGEQRRQQLGGQVKWILTGILAPEFVLLTASNQYREASNFAHELS